MAETRPYQPEDRDAAIAALNDPRAIDQRTHHIHVSAAGPHHGLALWIEPGPGGEPYLADVINPFGSRRLFYELVRACALDAIERGYSHASFTIHTAALLARLRRDFDVDPQPYGRDPATQEPVSWEIRVDLVDAIQQLNRAINSLNTPDGAHSG